MRAVPFGNYSNIEYEDAAGYKDGGRHMNPQRYNGFPTATPILQSADIDFDQALERSNLIRLKNSYPLNENGNLTQGSSPVTDWKRRTGQVESHMRNTRFSGEGPGYPKSNYKEGPSNYFHGSSNGRFGESPIQHTEYDVPKSFEYLERDRAELLRKLSELEDQLMRSGSAGEQGNQRHHVERRKYHHEHVGSSGDWLQESSSVSSGSPSRITDKRFANVSPYHEKHPYNERHSLTTRDPYLTSGSSNDVKRQGEYADSQFPRRGTASTPYQEYSPYRSHLPLQSANTAVPRMSGSPHYYKPQHQLDCSCFQCYNSNLGSPLHVQSRSSVNSRYTDLSSNPKLYHQKDAQMENNSGKSYLPVAMGGQINNVRWPSALESVDEVVHSYPENTAPVKVKRSFHPVAGGAPFVICSNCFELLQVRREIMKLHNQLQKIQCGACSSLTCFFVEGKNIVFSFQKESMGKSSETRCGPNMEEAKENSKDMENTSNKAVKETLHIRGPSRASKSFHSDEFNCSVHDEGIGDLEEVQDTTYITLEQTKEGPNKSADSLIKAVDITSRSDYLENENDINVSNAGCESPLTDHAPVLSMPKYASLSNKSLDESSLLSAVDSEDDTPEECPTGQEELASLDDAADELISPSSTNSARQEHHGVSPSKHAVYWFGTHSQIIRAQNEENDLEISPRENVVPEIPTETETEVPKPETPKANSSLDTTCDSTYDDPPNIKDGGSASESIRQRVLRLAQSIQYTEEKCNVKINERPIPDLLVKKAEDLAGSILPGDYWYDFRAGFWGVTGGPCLGIIPPKIQQFNYPILKNCSGGTTGVVVNGRELHVKDLALLHSRGLPIERGKSYIVEISGRVLDEISGEEVRNLGPLAPTIERLKRGFGMRASRHH